MKRKSIIRADDGLQYEVWRMEIPCFVYTYHEVILHPSQHFQKCMESLYLVIGPLVLSFGWTRYADQHWWEGEWWRVRTRWASQMRIARQYDFTGFLSAGWAIKKERIFLT